MQKGNKPRICQESNPRTMLSNFLISFTEGLTKCPVHFERFKEETPFLVVLRVDCWSRMMRECVKDLIVDYYSCVSDA